jgi:hypothetical protein
MLSEPENMSVNQRQVQQGQRDRLEHVATASDVFASNFLFLHVVDACAARQYMMDIVT